MLAPPLQAGAPIKVIKDNHTSFSLGPLLPEKLSKDRGGMRSNGRVKGRHLAQDNEKMGVDGHFFPGQPRAVCGKPF